MAEFEPKQTPIYLQTVEVGEICFLQEALYWVAFGRLPIETNNRDALIESYKTNLPNGNGELTEDECKRAGVAPDPRLKYNWAGDVMLSDQLDEIMVSRELFEDETGEDEKITKDQVRNDAEQLLNEMRGWKPKFERAIELAASEVYAALRKGLLTSKGVRLPDPDLAVSQKLLTEQNKKMGELADVAIPKDFWSLPNIYWEISAARNDTDHYCQIHCPTGELMSVFSIGAVTTDESVEGLTRHGSFYVLSPTSGAAATPARRSQARSRTGGRHRVYRWDDLHVEMAALVRAGLPYKKEAAVEQLRQIYLQKYGAPAPALRTLHDWLKPYYERYGGNLDR